MKGLDTTKQERLNRAKVIWMATVTPSSQPHMVPIWFVIHDDRIWCCTSSSSVKATNLRNNPSVAISLEDGSSPVIGQGKVRILTDNYPEPVVEKFIEKHDWDITKSTEYDMLVEITIDHWLMN